MTVIDDPARVEYMDEVPENQLTPAVRGRASGFNPKNRFEHVHREPDMIADAVPTQFLNDQSKSILSKNDSPDIPFTYSINPYRGCEHGCIYCYARPSHEYLGLSAGLDYETKVFVKTDAAALLEKEFRKPTWKPDVICLSGNTDCYQPIERKLGITRALLTVFLRYRNPVRVITKNALIIRDLDILKQLAALNLVRVILSVTTLDRELTRRMEPRTSSPQLRMKAIRELRSHGIPVGVMVAPVIPGLNDHELPEILRHAAEAGATQAGYALVRLPGSLPELFADWLQREYPTRAAKVLHSIRDSRGGKLNHPEFGKRHTGEGEVARHVSRVFKIFCDRYALNRPEPALSTASFIQHGYDQLGLFSE